MYNVSSKVMSLEELQGHRHRWQVRPPYQCGVPPLPQAPRSILQNQGKTEVLHTRTTDTHEGINQRYLKNWADVADKISFSRT